MNANLLRAMRIHGWDAHIIALIEHKQPYPADKEFWSDLYDCVTTITVNRSFGARLLGYMRTFFSLGIAVPGGVWAIPALESALAAHAREPFDFLVSRSFPNIGHLPALMMARRTGVPWIACWDDPDPLGMAPPHGDGKGIVPQSVARFHREIVRTAARHIVPNQRLRELMSGYMPDGFASRCEVIPHIALDRYRQEQQSHEGFVLMHAGQLPAQRHPGVFLEGLRRFLSRDRPEKFQFKVLSRSAPLVHEISYNLGIAQFVTCQPPVPYGRIHAQLAQSDALLIIEAPSLQNGVFLPSKVVDYSLIGLPILSLSPRAGTMVDLLSEHGGGIAVDGTDPDAVANALSELYAHWKDHTLIELYGSSRLLEQFSEREIIDRYSKLFTLLQTAT